MTGMKIVLAYSGGLDTSVLLSWIREKYDAEMIAFCANIGQEEELRGLEAKAKRTGASQVFIDDLREEFARDFIYPMIHAGAVYEGQYFLGTSIARPLIARRMVEIARREKAGAIAHGATGKGNDRCVLNSPPPPSRRNCASSPRGAKRVFAPSFPAARR